MNLEAIIPVSKVSTEELKTGHWSPQKPWHTEKISPCREACPAGNDIPEFMYLAAEGRFDEALAEVLKENPFPGVCGRVCFHPCQAQCNRMNMEGPVEIREVERAIAEYGRAQPRRLRGGGGKRVAVVGSGPAGIAAAYFLGLLGHQVVVLERREELGGVLRYGIPEYRLPKEVLRRELGHLSPLEVVFRPSAPVSAGDLARLREDFEGVVLATGAWSPRRLGVRGEDLKGVHYGLPWLSDPEVPEGVREVVVIGGGDVAVDVARVARRLAPEARIRMVAPEEEGEFPAIPEGLQEAQEEGIEIEGGFRPLELVGDGEVRAVRFRRCRAQRDPETGALRIVDLGGDRTERAQVVIVAIGQVPEEGVIPEGILRDGVTDWGETGLRGVFLAGDLVNRRATVVHAISSGKRAALGLHLRLSGEDPGDVLPRIRLGGGAPSFKAFIGDSQKRLDKVAAFAELSRYLFPDLPPHRVRKLGAGERVRDFGEVRAGLGREEAAEEAKRCFNCGKCTKCDLCYLLCPDVAIVRGEPYSVRADYCKGCGLCAEVCPRNVVEIG